MKIKQFTLVSLISFFIVSAFTFAQVPSLINYQGRVRDGSGIPLNGNIIVFLEVYTAETGGAAVTNWNIGSVSVTNGVYSFNFGNDALSVILDNPECWLEVTVDGNILSPRQRLVAVPYAITSGESQNVRSTYVWTGTNSEVAGVVAGNAGGGRHLIINDIPEARWGFSSGNHALKIENYWGSNWTRRVEISRSGNMGIGCDPGADTKLAILTSTNRLDGLDLRSLAGGMIRFVPWTLKGDWNGLGHNGDQKIVFSRSEIGSGNLVIVPHADHSKGLIISSNGYVGVSIDDPMRPLHINDVMRLQPRATPPDSPAAGDMYIDSSATNTLKVYNGTAWKSCW